MKLSLRWKIVGGFGLLLLLIAVLGWVTLSLFGSVRGVQKRVFDDAIPGLVAVEEIVRYQTKTWRLFTNPSLQSRKNRG